MRWTKYILPIMAVRGSTNSSQTPSTTTAEPTTSIGAGLTESQPMNTYLNATNELSSNASEPLTSSQIFNSSDQTPSDPTSCEDFCGNNLQCRTSSSGSYCKSWQSVPVCFGFYWRETTQTNACYSPTDPTCPQSLPVVCPNLTTPTPVPFDTCQVNCLVTPKCAFGPKHQGSYCKVDHRDIPTCFGLYWRDAAQTIPCYFPEDPTCPQNDPIRCG
jgi:hypothetical protein